MPTGPRLSVWTSLSYIHVCIVIPFIRDVYPRAPGELGQLVTQEEGLLIHWSFLFDLYGNKEETNSPQLLLESKSMPVR